MFLFILLKTDLSAVAALGYRVLIGHFFPHLLLALFPMNSKHTAKACGCFVSLRK